MAQHEDGKPASSPPPPRQKRKALRLVLWNVGVLLAGIVALELVFGHWFHPDHTSSLNLLRSIRIRHRLKGLYPWPEEYVVYTKDRYGFRGDYGRVSGIDVLTMGGSTTDQRYISDGCTWQDVLQEDFRKGGKRLSVVNAGADGHSTLGHLRSFEVWFPKVHGLKARYVLVYVGLNDLRVDPHNTYDILSRPDRGFSIRDFLESRSALAHVYFTARRVWRARALDVGHGRVDFAKVRWTAKGLYEGDHARMLSERLDAYEQRLKVLIERIRAFGAEPILVTQKSRRYVVDPKGSVRGMAGLGLFDGNMVNGVDYCLMERLLNARTVATARKEGALALDLAGELAFEDEDYYDSDHNTPAGARKIGDYLYEKLKDVVK